MKAAQPERKEFTEKEKRSIEIMEILRRQGPISRPEISKEVGINVVTISNYLDDFIKNRLVQEKELDVSEGGRRPTLLDLNPHGAYVIGVGLNMMNVVGLLVDLKGNIITKAQVTRTKMALGEIPECLLEVVREIFRRSKQYTNNIRGAGIGIAGLVNKSNSSVHWPQKIEHYYTYASVDLSLRDLIEKEFDLPAFIENDANCACFGEHWLDLERRFKNIIYLFSGAGCGIMINGELYTGAHGYAGEVYISNFKEEEHLACALGRGCFLKHWDMDLGIVDDVKAMLAKDEQLADRFFKLTSTNINDLNLKHVFSAAKAQEPVSSHVLEVAAKRFGIKIAYFVNLLNPEVIVIGGALEDAGEEFLNKINLTVREWAFREATADLKIVYSQLRENAVALGAASLVIEKVFAGLL